MPTENRELAASCIYEGLVRHRRREPIEHDFRYRLFMMFLDLDELPDLFRDRWLWGYESRTPAVFRRSDHFGDPSTPLSDTIRQLIREKTGAQANGPIRVLAHMRYFGICFNPISVYFCYDSEGRYVEHIVAEVSNTPWLERHCYVLSIPEDRRQERKQSFQTPKVFHVSPFMDMDMEYRWRFVLPSQRLVVCIENRVGERSLFDATMTMTRREITGAALARCLMRYPVMTARVVTGIYFQAFRLWRKGVPFFPHPRYRENTAET